MQEFNELLGIVKAIDFDGVINQQEIEYLRAWLDEKKILHLVVAK